MKTQCLFWKDGHCNSDYGKNIECDSEHIPEQCPYHKKSLQKEIIELKEKIRERKS